MILAERGNCRRSLEASGRQTVRAAGINNGADHEAITKTLQKQEHAQRGRGGDVDEIVDSLLEELAAQSRIG